MPLRSFEISRRISPHILSISMLAAVLGLTSLSAVTFLWHQAGVPPPCGTGLGCAYSSVRLFGFRFEPAAWVLPALLLPWILVLSPPRHRKSWLQAGLFGQAWIALVIQFIVFRDRGTLCPYCLAIALLHVALAIASLITLPPFRPKVVWVVLGSLATSGFIAHHAMLIVQIRDHPIAIERLHDLGEVPEALTVAPLLAGATPISGQRWLVFVDPDCRVCDQALYMMADQITKGDGVQIVIDREGQRHSGARLWNALQSAPSLEARVQILRRWPEIRQTGAGTPDPDAISAVRRQATRAHSLAVVATPLVMMKSSAPGARWTIESGTAESVRPAR